LVPTVAAASVKVIAKVPVAAAPGLSATEKAKLSLLSLPSWVKVTLPVLDVVLGEGAVECPPRCR